MPTTPAERPKKKLLRLRIACAGEPIFKARGRVSVLARRLGFSDEATEGILLAFSEAVSNAVVYGTPPGGKCVRADVWVENGRLIIEVTDHGCGFHPDTVKLPPPDSMSEGGRGLYLMSVFMDDVEWLASPHGTTVRMTKCCVAPAAAEATSASPAPPSSSVPAPTLAVAAVPNVSILP